MVFVLLIIYLILFVGISYSFLNKRKSFFLFFITFIWLYDWLFINLSYYFPQGIVLAFKALQEYLLIVIFLVFCSRVAISGKIKKQDDIKNFFLVILLPFISLILISFFQGYGLTDLILGIRNFYIPLLFPFCVYKYGILYNINNLALKKLFIFLTALTVIYAFWQCFSFNGDLSSLWFYKNYEDPVDLNLVDKSYYNFLKNDKLRATSFFVTPIDLSIILSMIMSYFTIALFYKFSIVDFVFFIVSGYGMYLSQTKIGLFLYLLDLLLIILYWYNKRFFFGRFYLILFYPLFLIFTTVLFLLIGFFDDLSAIGRLGQYASFIDNFKIFGNGLGNKEAVLDYDSFYLCLLNVMGVFAILYLGFYLMLVNIVYKIVMNSESRSSILNIFVMINSVSFLYIYAFHHIAGSIVQSLLLFCIYCVIALDRLKLYPSNVSCLGK